MNKTLIATAVAMTVSGSAFAGTAADGLWGSIRLGLQTTDNATKSTGELDLISQKLVFGFVGSEDLGNGMTVRYGLQLEHDGADAESATKNWTNDNSYIGLSGDFGEVIAGEYGDFAYMGATNGTEAVEFGTTWAATNVHNTSPANTIQYRGSAGAINFGVGLVADGSAAQNTLIGFGYSGDNFSFGAQLVDADSAGAGQGGVAAGDSGTVIGGSYNLGDLTLGVTLGDNGSSTDSEIIDFGIRGPLGSGSFKVVMSSGDVVDTDVLQLEYKQSLSDRAYWGINFIDDDRNVDARSIAFVRMGF